jgi:O-antigen ligase
MSKIYYPKWLTTMMLIVVFYVPILNPLIPKTEFGAGLPDIDFQRICAVLLGITFIWTWMSVPRCLTWHRWLGNLVIFGLIVMLSPFWSDVYDYNSAILQEMFVNVVLPFLVAVSAFAALRTDKAIQRYCFHACISASILSVYAIFQFITKSSISQGELRSMGTFDNPNPFAVYLVMLLSIIIYATESRRIPKLIGYAVQIILLVGVLTTVSRKGIFTAFVTLEVFFVLTRRYKEIIISLGLSFILGTVAWSYSEFSGRFDDKEITMNIVGREAMAMAGLRMYIENPVIGFGYKGYYENFGDYFYGSTKDKFDAHNEYVTTLVNFGAIGFFLFMMIFLMPLYYGWRLFITAWKLKQLNISMLTMAGICSIITFMASQYFSGAIFYLYSTVLCLLYANIGLMLAKRNDISPLIRRGRKS